MPHAYTCGILAYQKKVQKMWINTAYKEGLKKILETGDMSRVRQERRDYISGRKEIFCKEFLSRAEESQEYDEVPGDAMLALVEWQKAYKECIDIQRECSILVGSNKDFQAARKIAQSSAVDEDARRSAMAKMRIIKKRIIEENRATFEHCYKAQEELEKARKAIQAQVEPYALEYQEPMDYERI